MELRSQRLFLALILTQVAHFEAGTKGIVAPRVKVTLGQATAVCLVMKNGQLVLE
jgi:hypothetical protein